MKTECEGCGAPLNLQRHECEYCRRDIQRKAAGVLTQRDQMEGLRRYAMGYTDPRALYNMMASNSQGQAMVDHYNSQQNATNADWLGHAASNWWGRS